MKETRNGGEDLLNLSNVKETDNNSLDIPLKKGKKTNKSIDHRVYENHNSDFDSGQQSNRKQPSFVLNDESSMNDSQVVFDQS